MSAAVSVRPGIDTAVYYHEFAGARFAVIFQNTTAQLLGRGADPVAKLVARDDTSALERLASYCTETGAKVLGVFPHGTGHVLEIEAQGRVAQVLIKDDAPPADVASLMDAVFARLSVQPRLSR